MGQEQRNAQRIMCNMEVEIWGRKVQNDITDLSSSGMFIYTGTVSRFNLGDEIDLILKFPNDKEARMIKAIVARLEDKGMGVKLIKLTPDIVDAIKDCCCTLADTLPSDDKILKEMRKRLESSTDEFIRVLPYTESGNVIVEMSPKVWKRILTLLKLREDELNRITENGFTIQT